MGTNGVHETHRKDAHIPVLLDEVLFWLACRSGGCYVDCTLGYGGHAAKILEQIGQNGVLIGVDQDEQAILVAQERFKPFAARAQLIRGNFSDLGWYLASYGLSEVDGVLFDLGVSSAQLDCPERGFSFLVEGPLDMRMNQTSGPTAADLLVRLSEKELADLIYRYGEERYSRRIARAIVQARAHRPLRTTRELASIVQGAVPPSYRHRRLHPATRAFQALRVAVNRELDVLERALPEAAAVLAPGGRLCAISFHSLEDRIVKQTFRTLSQGPKAYLRILTKKPIVPSKREVQENPRARSAKLRVAERLPEKEEP